MEAALEWCAWRVTQKGDKITHEEIFSIGGMNRTFALGKEFDSSNEFTGEEVSFTPPTPQVAVVTSDYPGSYTLTARPAKGLPIVSKWTVDAKGMRGTCSSGPHSCSYSYSRIPDTMVGGWWPGCLSRGSGGWWRCRGSRPRWRP